MIREATRRSLYLWITGTSAGDGTKKPAIMLTANKLCSEMINHLSWLSPSICLTGQELKTAIPTLDRIAKYVQVLTKPSQKPMPSAPFGNGLQVTRVILKAKSLYSMTVEISARQHKPGRITAKHIISTKPVITCRKSSVKDPPQEPYL